MRKRILVLPAGTEIGHEIGLSLQFSKHWELVGANSIADHSELLFDELYLDMPSVYDRDFKGYVKNICKEKNIDAVIPSHDEASYLLSGMSREIKIIGPTERLAETLRFKSATLRKLKDVVPVPTWYRISEYDGCLPFPLFVKPDRGQGSKGTVLVENCSQLASIKATAGFEFLIQEYLPGKEVTVDCFSDQDSKVIFVGPRQRVRVQSGIAVRVYEETDTDEFTLFAEAISRELKMQGVWFFQMKQDVRGQYSLLEVANRVAGAMGYQRIMGINLVDAWIHQSFGKSIAFKRNMIRETALIDRALYPKVRWDFRPEALYVDFDDTIYFVDSNSLNSRLVGVLFGLKVGFGTKIKLITRHKGDLGAKLTKLNITCLFDEVIHIQNDDPKYGYIVEPNAIFLDDSYKERTEVLENRPHVYCFGPESIDLIEGCLKGGTDD